MHSDRRAFLGRGAIGVTAAALAMSGTGRVGAADVPHAFVDVRDFGARGDGATDDTAAIQAAVDTLRSPDRPGGCVLFPSGTYLVSASIVVDYGITLRGVNPAASTIRMSPAVLADLIVGGPSFPVYVHLVDLTLDGGLDSHHRDDVPAGSASVRLVGSYDGRTLADRVSIAGGAIARGDVLRVAGQPPIVVVGGAGGDSGYVTRWAPTRALVAPIAELYRSGSLIRGIARPTIVNCRLVNAKRHAIELERSTEGTVTGCEIGGNHGAGLAAIGSTDLTLSSTWMFANGGPDVLLTESVDVRIAQCILEGSGSASVHAEWSELEIVASGIWGGRVALVLARHAGFVRLDGLKLRDPGYGDDDPTSFAAAGFATLPARPAIDVHLADDGAGVVATGCRLHHALAATGPLARIRNGSRSNLAGLEWHSSITFAGGDHPSAIVDDRGTATIIRGVRGVPDSG